MLVTEVGGDDMSQPKIKIGQVSLERIRRLRESGKSINYIANKYEWPRSVINRICAGVDVEFFTSRIRALSAQMTELVKGI